MLLKEELFKTFKSKKSLLLFIYLMMVAFADNAIGIMQKKGFGPFGGYSNVHPMFMSLLSGQAYPALYHLFFWIAPITITLLYCCRYVQESKSRMNNVYLSKVGRKKLFLSKLSCSFIVPMIYFGIPLVVNLFVGMIFLNGGTSFQGLEEFSVYDFDSMSRHYLVAHPYIGWSVYFVVAMLVLGLAGVMVQSIAMISKDLKITLLVPFAIWMTLFSAEYDLSMAMQPFTEFGLVCMGMALLSYIPFVIASVILAYIFVVIKKDEI